MCKELLPGGASGKKPACQRRRSKRRGFDPWVRKIPWRRTGQPTPVFLLACPMGRGAWWATVHRVAQSWTQLKRLAAAKSLQSCPTLWDPIDGSSSGSPVPGILQARTLECVVISFSNAWKWKVKMKSFSRVRLFVTPWTAAYQVPPSMEFSRQEYWSGVPVPSLCTGE